ncbi:MAG TPA: hypothetical protein VGH38_00425, partial [Bryobacteraceae bacterium]
MTQNSAGQAVSVTPDSTYSSLPAVLTPGGNGNLATSISYATSWAVTSVTGPNGATNTTTYDTLGRPLTSTIPDGARTDYTYSYNPYNTQTAILCPDPIGSPCPTVTTIGHQWTTSTQDGFGRTTKVEKGHDSVTISTVDTVYKPCACSPLGKMSAVTLPYKPGATPVWTVYAYDGSGRTLSVKVGASDSLGNNAAGTTTYSYQGNVTTVTDPAGKWKKFTTDAMGNLALVAEPNPGGGSDFTTAYTYNAANQLTGVNMLRNTDTQARGFGWTGSDLTTATNPENGTVSYTYDGAHHPLTRTDAKGQQTQYSYDTYGRLAEVRHYVLVPPYNQLQEVTNQRVDYSYDTDYTGLNGSNWGRLAQVTFQPEAGGNGETLGYLYSYNQAGRVTTQRMRVYYKNWQNFGAPADLDARYQWDTVGRMKTLTYPGM